MLLLPIPILEGPLARERKVQLLFAALEQRPPGTKNARANDDLLSWQIVPTLLPKLMADPTGRVMWVALGLGQAVIFALTTAKSFSGELRA